MATTRIIPLHTGKGRTVGKAISDIIGYVKNPEKTDHGRLITSYQCDSRVADAQFLLDKQTYAARTGRVRGADDVIAYHLRQSFVPGEISPEEANRLGVELARRFTKGKHAFIVCTHIDKAHVHNHIIWNSTTLECDRKFRNFWGSTRAVHRLSDTICIENGYSIVEAPKRRGQSYNKWLGDTAKPSHKEQLRQSIDRALAQKPASLEELLHLLEQEGFTVHRRGKTISVSAEGWGNNVRFDRLGDGYTLDDLLAVLSGQKVHTPRKLTAVQAASPKVNLLVDIQDKLKAGKGAGYARWAKVFNLKQMAQTLNYLSEHGLLDYTDLETKTAEATARYNALSGKIKAAEKRMAEIAVLRTHIINYAIYPFSRQYRISWSTSAISQSWTSKTILGRVIGNISSRTGNKYNNLSRSGQGRYRASGYAAAAWFCRKGTADRVWLPYAAACAPSQNTTGGYAK